MSDDLLTVDELYRVTWAIQYNGLKCPRWVVVTPEQGLDLRMSTSVTAYHTAEIGLYKILGLDVLERSLDDDQEIPADALDLRRMKI